MNWVDLAILLLLGAGAVRGFLRGTFREVLGLLGIIAAVVAAEQGAATGAALVHGYVALPEPLSTGVSFVVIFALVHLLFNATGALLERSVARPLARLLSGVAGAIVGAGKATVVCAVVLLLLHLLPVVPSVDARIMESSVARPLIAIAGTAMRAGMRGSTHGSRPSQS